ncbi:hypothetical protein APHAL10511_008377 [Amanita phalloides]|nr:hypothetical protein APHAL10511_008377 [Amanita phalloides]
MDPPTQEQTQRLRASISQPLPCCTGMIQVPQKDLVIYYYGKDESAHRLDLLHASDESLEHLAAACEPATFGLNRENVHDESYRKARKLGSEAFMPTLDLTNLGLINIVCDSLLRGTGSASHHLVRAELYNLNVYGKDSFFMPHVDTPRSASMFGSLVIFYPTHHEGGTLVMWQGDKEWTFDSATVLSDGAESRIGYAAFYSDMEHEVNTVTIGHRVTVTYNLYFEVPSEMPVMSPHASVFKATLQSLLLDEAFLPNGGLLAFGLQHGYALPSKAFTEPLDKYLKGSDAEILHMAKELSLGTSLWTLVKNDTSQYLCQENVDLEGNSFYSEEGSFGEWFKNFTHTAKRLRKCGRFKVHWITKPSEANVDKQAYGVYGNEASVDFAYNSICLLLKIGGPGSRVEYQNLEDDEEDNDDDEEDDDEDDDEGF